MHPLDVVFNPSGASIYVSHFDMLRILDWYAPWKGRHHRTI